MTAPVGYTDGFRGNMKRFVGVFVGGLVAAGLAIGTAPSAGAECGVAWINQQTCNKIEYQYMIGNDFDTYLSYLVPDPNDRAAVRDFLWNSRI